MKQLSSILTMVSLALIPIISSSQPPDKIPGLEVIKLSDTIYKLECTTDFAASVLACVGADGVLLIDTGHRGTADSLKKVAAKWGKVRYVINTHYHGDHVGGNYVFDEDALIMGHYNAHEALSGYYYHLPGNPDANMPDAAIFDELAMNFNGETIRAFHIPGAHTDGDLLVYFAESKILHVGDLVFSVGLPYVDVYQSNGDVEGYARHVKALIDTLSPEVRIVCSHGPDYSVLELMSYYNLIVETADLVWKGAEAGMSKEQMQEENLLKKWETHNWRWVDANGWLGNLYDYWNLKNGKQFISICDPMTEALASGSAENAIMTFKKLKKEKPEEYDFSEFQVNMLGYQLMNRKMYDEAVEIFKLNVKEHPKSWNVYDSMGEACMNKGLIDQAIESYEKSIKLNPENTNAVEMLKKLKK